MAEVCIVELGVVATLLQQALANLIENAVFHGGAPIHISVSTRTEEGRAILRVADHGIGVPESEREKVLRRFYRINQADPAPGSVSTMAPVHSPLTSLVR